jgi:hypothetical protein
VIAVRKFTQQVDSVSIWNECRGIQTLVGIEGQSVTIDRQENKQMRTIHCHGNGELLITIYIVSTDFVLRSDFRTAAIEKKGK